LTALGIEVVDVDRGPAGELFDLAFANRNPAARSIASAVSSKEPRAASTAASFRSPCECFSTGRFSCASAGYRLA
jgi:hypothetical protein